jgi:Winged helix DNA-binding domain
MDIASDVGVLRLARLRSQMLSGEHGDSPESVVRRLLSVQAQDERGFRLAIRSRSSGLLARDVDVSLNERRLVATWLNRGTLHLVRSDDYWWLHTLTAPRVVTGVERRLRQEGVDEFHVERGVRTIVASLESEGPLSRRELRARLDGEGVPTEGRAFVQLLAAVSLRGLIVRGPVVNGNHAYVSVRDWLGAPPTPLERREALGRLALRYLAGHAPASPQDLAKWTGITLGDAQLGFNELADVLRIPDGNYVLRSGDLQDPPVPPVRLLGAFDPLLHGWDSREIFVGKHRAVVTTNGIFRSVGLVAGRVVATWRLPSSGIVIEPLECIDGATMSALVADAADVHRFLELKVGPGRVT